MQQIRIEYMALGELVKRYHPQNPKEHDIGSLITSMRRFGFNDPGAIDEKSGLFAEGHGRCGALVEMKRQQMDAPRRIEVRADDWYTPVIRGLEFDSPEELKAYLIAANRMTELGGWDEPKLAEVLQEIANQDAELLKATGYDEDDFNSLLFELNPHFDPVGADEQPRLDQKSPVVCPECGHEFVPKS